ncbi:hypothetical protein OC846_004515 [Tilletia horrida]|uniref:NADH dehydrogenase [ubiquinone] iron-sulfur protein 5 n=1 Tax=Tilletia horrida TaxID=155126 RepID=A0AAN6JSQ6_9BASI|nr:hypothetical protein OC845_006170 [Tilletia horrida]KAK0548329.1 hypothetical protein OC846_004515 [Tilletia horrida]KAK0563347.1 hypothetical protein OC861_004854 [Tilletia horrida]
MASGFGYGGGQSRCFQFYQEFRKCYASAEFPTECALQRADYIECLHHKKEIARTRAVKEHLLERVAKEVKEARSRGELSASGNPLRVNLIIEDAPEGGSSKEGGSSSSSSGESDA